MALLYTWGLWSVRRSDLQDVWNEGFDFVRPPYPDVPNPERSGQWQDGSNPRYFDQTDNYDSTLNYAYTAQQIGFTRLVYDLGLSYLYEEYRHTVVDPNYGVGNPNIPRSLQEIRDKVSNRIAYMSAGGMDRVTGNNLVLSSIICQPYLDEPDYFAQQRSNVQGPSGPLWEDYTAGLAELMPPPGKEWTAEEYVQALNNLSDTSSQIYNAINRDIIAEFRDLVNFAIGVANSCGRPLIIATTTPDIIRRCHPPTENCSSIPVYKRDDFAGYHYNSLGVGSLWSSLYDTASHMSSILAAIQSNYNKPVQQLINFWDTTPGMGGCRNACTVQEIIDQINVNSRFTAGENWFYQGDCISLNITRDGKNSITQWNNLLQATYSFGRRPRA